MPWARSEPASSSGPGNLMVDVVNHRALTAPERDGNRAEPTDERFMGDVSPA